MNLKSEILGEYSKPRVLKIANYIGNDKQRFSELMKLFLDVEYRVTQRAAWVVSHCCDQNPLLIHPYMERIIHNLGKDIPIAVKRNTLRILQFVAIPTALMGPLADYCFTYLTDVKEPIAVKVFSMTILSNIAKEFPELKSELQMAIEDQMPYGSAGFISRGRKVLKEIRN